MRIHKPLTQEDAYKRNIKNLKSIRNCLRKSWMWKGQLEKINNMLENFTFEEYQKEGLRDASHKYWCNWLCWMWVFNRPFKIKGRYWLDKVKDAIENRKKFRDCNYELRYDKSIDIEPSEDWDIRGRYSREYHWCWNWHYYMLLDWDTAVFLEND